LMCATTVVSIPFKGIASQVDCKGVA